MKNYITFEDRKHFWKFINYGGKFFTENLCKSKFKNEAEFQKWLIIKLKQQNFQVYEEVKNANGRADIVVFKNNKTIIIELKDLRDGEAINKLSCAIFQLIKYKQTIKADYVAMAFLMPDGFEDDWFLLFHSHFLSRMGFVILKYSNYQDKIMFKNFQFEVFNND